jgi:sigma-B regulation protein RsbU (phosphoserine phosphatase)
LPLGIREDETFSKLSIPFEGNDVFVFYSDGITEARNAAGEQFGMGRLIECLRRHVHLGPQPLVAAIRDATLLFSQPAALADDLTCVAMKVVGVPVLAHYDLEISSDLQQLHQVRGFVRDVCGDSCWAGLDQAACSALELAVDEAVSNIINHAQHGDAHQRIQLEADVFMEHVSVRLRYWGDAFDPSLVPPPTWDGSRENGFGIYLIAHSVDDAQYYRDEKGRNCIALRKSRR